MRGARNHQLRCRLAGSPAVSYTSPIVSFLTDWGQCIKDGFCCFILARLTSAHTDGAVRCPSSSPLAICEQSAGNLPFCQHLIQNSYWLFLSLLTSFRDCGCSFWRGR